MRAHTAGDCFLYSTAGVVSYKTIQNIQTSHSHCRLRVRFVVVPSDPTAAGWCGNLLSLEFNSSILWHQVHAVWRDVQICVSCKGDSKNIRSMSDILIHLGLLKICLMVPGMQIPCMVAWVIFQDVKIKSLFVWNPTH